MSVLYIAESHSVKRYVGHSLPALNAERAGLLRPSLQRTGSRLRPVGHLHLREETAEARAAPALPTAAAIVEASTTLAVDDVVDVRLQVRHPRVELRLRAV